MGFPVTAYGKYDIFWNVFFSSVIHFYGDSITLTGEDVVALVTKQPPPTKDLNLDVF